MDERKSFRWRRSYGNNQQYKSKQITPSTTTTGNGSKHKEPDKGTQKSRTRDLEKRTRNEKKENKMDEDVCFGCGQKGHKKRDPKCPKNNQTKKVVAQLYAARDIIQEDDEEDDQEVIQPVEEDGDGNSEEEEEDLYYGSQYTSEGEEVEINDLEHQEWSDQECAGERMHMMRTQERQEMKIIDEKTSSEREFPLLVEVDDEEGIEEIEEITLNKEAFRALNAGLGINLGRSLMKNDEHTPLKLRKLSKILERPICSKKETQTFVIMVKVNGQKAIALLDSECTTDAVTPELTRITRLKIYELKEQVPLQLGTRGSQSKINYGTKACIKYGLIEVNQYFDIVNIDRYDVTLRTVFMRKHRIILDFKRNQVRIGDKELPMLRKDADEYLQIHRQAMCNRLDVPKDRDIVNRTERPYGKSNRH
jgi:hypothetical protein